MGLLDKFKNIIFEEIEDENSPKKEEQVIEEQQNSNPSNQEQNNFASMDAYTNNNQADQTSSQNQIYNLTPQIDENILKNLLDLLEEKNIPGADYVELKNAANTQVLKNAIPDENTRFTVSYATLKATSPQISKQSILSSIDVYIQTMEEERANGLSQFNNMWQENIVIKEEEIKKSQEELEKLYARITELNSFIEKASLEVEQVKLESQSKKNNFNFTVDYLIDTFNKDKEKLENILKD